ncbi:MAG: ABC transporter permease [Firmicutes bacterium]|nr:ABC transporter permease [Bacillota bacterium]
MPEYYKLKNRKILLGSLIILLVAIFAILLTPLSAYSYHEQNLEQANMRPSAEHWFGTDRLGRDLFTRVGYGTQTSLLVAIAAALIELTIGTIYGTLSGYLGGLVDEILMRAIDILFSIPYLLLAILLLVLLPPGKGTLILAIGFTGWPHMARIARILVIRLKTQDFFLAARCYGAGHLRLICGHMLPQMLKAIFSQLTLSIPAAIYSEAFLSFIGLGVPMPQASLGSLIQEGFTVFPLYPYQLFYPAFVLSLLLLGFTFIGDGLQSLYSRKLLKGEEYFAAQPPARSFQPTGFISYKN